MASNGFQEEVDMCLNMGFQVSDLVVGNANLTEPHVNEDQRYLDALFAGPPFYLVDHVPQPATVPEFGYAGDQQYPFAPGLNATSMAFADRYTAYALRTIKWSTGKAAKPVLKTGKKSYNSVICKRTASQRDDSDGDRSSKRIRGNDGGAIFLINKGYHNINTPMSGIRNLESAENSADAFGRRPGGIFSFNMRFT